VGRVTITCAGSRFDDGFDADARFGQATRFALIICQFNHPQAIKPELNKMEK
jgi:hypothetical protein